MPTFTTITRRGSRIVAGSIQDRLAVLPGHFRPTRANFHEPSFCRFSKRMPVSLKLTGSSFADILYMASTFPTSIAQPSAICTFVISVEYCNTLNYVWVLGVDFLIFGPDRFLQTTGGLPS